MISYKSTSMIMIIVGQGSSSRCQSRWGTRIVIIMPVTSNSDRQLELSWQSIGLGLRHSLPSLTIRMVASTVLVRTQTSFHWHSSTSQPWQPLNGPRRACPQPDSGAPTRAHAGMARGPGRARSPGLTAALLSLPDFFLEHPRVHLLRHLN